MQIARSPSRMAPERSSSTPVEDRQILADAESSAPTEAPIGVLCRGLTCLQRLTTLRDKTDSLCPECAAQR
ncbi:hypothetical protein GCM10009785_33550 [Brooklawnia cerclae]